MSQTTSQQCPLPTLTFDAQSYRHYAHWFQEQFITIGILGSLYGVLTILSTISVYALLKRRTGRFQPTAVILSLTVLTLFSSTTLYVAICILYYQYDFLDFFVRSAELLWTGSVYFAGRPDRPLGVTGTLNIPMLQACVGSATLTLNVVLGDAIVWWRACVIWGKNRIVKAVCGFFLLATLGLGIGDTLNPCQPMLGWYDYDDSSSTNVPGILFESLRIGTVASALSLCTNLVTTLLVAYKAWRSRRRLKGYLAAKIGGSQMEKLFALLVESGAMYCAIWVLVVAYQVASDQVPSVSLARFPVSAAESGFLDIFGVIMNGALVPAIAIYPTVIIVLVALNRSHMARGLTQQHLESLPTPHLALTVDTVATRTSLRESRLHRASEGPAEQREGSRGGDVDVSDADESESEAQDTSRRSSTSTSTSTSTSAERMGKAEEVVFSPTARNA